MSNINTADEPRKIKNSYRERYLNSFFSFGFEYCAVSALERVKWPKKLSVKESPTQCWEYPADKKRVRRGFSLHFCISCIGQIWRKKSFGWRALVKVGGMRIVGEGRCPCLTNCFHIETIFMGKFHRALSGSPSKPIFDAHFAVELVPAQWEPKIFRFLPYSHQSRWKHIWLF